MQLGAGRERRCDDGQRGRGHQRAGQALEGACADQHPLGGRDTAKQRGEAEQQEREDERTSLAPVIGRTAAEHEEARERDRIGVDHPLQVGGVETEARLDRRERDVDDAQVEDDHELRDAAHDQQPRRGGATVARGRRFRSGTLGALAARGAVGTVTGRHRRRARGRIADRGCLLAHVATFAGGRCFAVSFHSLKVPCTLHVQSWSSPRQLVRPAWCQKWYQVAPSAALTLAARGRRGCVRVERK